MPTFVQIVASGGNLPVSLTIHDGLRYVLNAGPGAINITGFSVAANGTLTPLAGSTRLLTTPIGAPAQVSFNPAGTMLVVTHKASDVLRQPVEIIDTFTVGANGLPGQAMPQASAGIPPLASPSAPPAAWS
jgi:hypothetical protein